VAASSLVSIDSIVRRSDAREVPSLDIDADTIVDPLRVSHSSRRAMKARFASGATSRIF